MSKQKKFGVKAGKRVKGNPQAIGEELERIRGKYKELTAANTIKEARAKSSPLHGQFNWNDTEAAHRYRLVQASTLIRAIVVIEKGRPPRRHYVNVRTETNRRKCHYAPMEVAVSEVDAYQSALEMLVAKLTGAAEAVQELREAAGFSERKGAMAVIGIIMKALEAATTAIKRLPK